MIARKLSQFMLEHLELHIMRTGFGFNSLEIRREKVRRFPHQ